MKVCFIVGTLARGGAEKQLVFMLRALQQTGIAAEVLSLTSGESYENEIRELGIPIEWVGTAKNPATRLWKIIGKLRETRADIVQSSHFYTNLYAGCAARFLRIPGIGAVRSDLIYEMKSHPLVGAWQIRLPHFLIVNSATARARLIERGIAPAKIEFVRNVVCTPNGAEPKENPAAPLKILFAGRLDRNKRCDRFIRLAAALIERFPRKKLQFLIAGDGERRGELERLAGELNLTGENLQFFGVCHEMSEIYGQADVLVSTSEREGTPNVVLEAMAYGLPVVATNVGGTAEILDATRGFLVASGDESATVESAARLIENPDLRRRLGATGRRYSLENHSLDNLQKHLLEIYERATIAIHPRKHFALAKTN